MEFGVSYKQYLSVQPYILISFCDIENIISFVNVFMKKAVSQSVVSPNALAACVDLTTSFVELQAMGAMLLY